jgi:hypothetical protein
LQHLRQRRASSAFYHLQPGLSPRNNNKFPRVSVKGKPLTHLQFRTELYCKLLSYSNKAKLQDLRIKLGGRRVFGPELQHLHYWERRKQGNCAWCLYESRCRKVLGKEVKGQVKRPRGGCIFCDVPLCKEAFILIMLITSNLLCNIHQSDAN